MLCKKHIFRLIFFINILHGSLCNHRNPNPQNHITTSTGQHSVRPLFEFPHQLSRIGPSSGRTNGAVSIQSRIVQQNPSARRVILQLNRNGGNTFLQQGHLRESRRPVLTTRTSLPERVHSLKQSFGQRTQGQRSQLQLNQKQRTQQHRSQQRRTRQQRSQQQQTQQQRSRHKRTQQQRNQQQRTQPQKKISFRQLIDQLAAKKISDSQRLSKNNPAVKMRVSQQSRQSRPTHKISTNQQHQLQDQQNNNFRIVSKQFNGKQQNGQHITTSSNLQLHKSGSEPRQVQSQITRPRQRKQPLRSRQRKPRVNNMHFSKTSSGLNSGNINNGANTRTVQLISRRNLKQTTGDSRPISSLFGSNSVADSSSKLRTIAKIQLPRIIQGIRSLDLNNPDTNTVTQKHQTSQNMRQRNLAQHSATTGNSLKNQNRLNHKQSISSLDQILSNGRHHKLKTNQHHPTKIQQTRRNQNIPANNHHTASAPLPRNNLDPLPALDKIIAPNNIAQNQLPNQQIPDQKQQLLQLIDQVKSDIIHLQQTKIQQLTKNNRQASTPKDQLNNAGHLNTQSLNHINQNVPPNLIPTQEQQLILQNMQNQRLNPLMNNGLQMFNDPFNGMFMGMLGPDMRQELMFGDTTDPPDVPDPVQNETTTVLTSTTTTTPASVSATSVNTSMNDSSQKVAYSSSSLKIDIGKASSRQIEEAVKAALKSSGVGGNIKVVIDIPDQNITQSKNMSAQPTSYSLNEPVPLVIDDPKETHSSTLNNVPVADQMSHSNSNAKRNKSSNNHKTQSKDLPLVEFFMSDKGAVQSKSFPPLDNVFTKNIVSTKSQNVLQDNNSNKNVNNKQHISIIDFLALPNVSHTPINPNPSRNYNIKANIQPQLSSNTRATNTHTNPTYNVNTNVPSQVPSNTRTTNPHSNPNYNVNTNVPSQVPSNTRTTNPHSNPNYNVNTNVPSQVPSNTRTTNTHTNPNYNINTNVPSQVPSNTRKTNPHSNPNYNINTNLPSQVSSKTQATDPNRNYKYNINNIPPQVSFNARTTNTHSNLNYNKNTNVPPQVSSNTRTANTHTNPNYNINANVPPQVSSNARTTNPHTNPNYDVNSNVPSHISSDTRAPNPHTNPSYNISTNLPSQVSSNTRNINPHTNPIYNINTNLPSQVASNTQATDLTPNHNYNINNVPPQASSNARTINGHTNPNYNTNTNVPPRVSSNTQATGPNPNTNNNIKPKVQFQDFSNRRPINPKNNHNIKHNIQTQVFPNNQARFPDAKPTNNIKVNVPSRISSNTRTSISNPNPIKNVKAKTQSQGLSFIGANNPSPNYNVKANLPQQIVTNTRVASSNPESNNGIRSKEQPQVFSKTRTPYLNPTNNIKTKLQPKVFTSSTNHNVHQVHNSNSFSANEKPHWNKFSVSHLNLKSKNTVSFSASKPRTSNKKINNLRSQSVGMSVSTNTQAGFTSNSPRSEIPQGQNTAQRLKEFGTNNADFGRHLQNPPKLNRFAAQSSNANFVQGQINQSPSQIRMNNVRTTGDQIMQQHTPSNIGSTLIQGPVSSNNNKVGWNAISQSALPSPTKPTMRKKQEVSVPSLDMVGGGGTLETPIAPISITNINTHIIRNISATNTNSNLGTQPSSFHAAGPKPNSPSLSKLPQTFSVIQNTPHRAPSIIARNRNNGKSVISAVPTQQHPQQTVPEKAHQEKLTPTSGKTTATSQLQQILVAIQAALGTGSKSINNANQNTNGLKEKTTSSHSISTKSTTSPSPETTEENEREDFAATATTTAATTTKTINMPSPVELVKEPALPLKQYNILPYDQNPCPTDKSLYQCRGKDMFINVTSVGEWCYGKCSIGQCVNEVCQCSCNFPIVKSNSLGKDNFFVQDHSLGQEIASAMSGSIKNPKHVNNALNDMFASLKQSNPELAASVTAQLPGVAISSPHDTKVQQPFVNGNPKFHQTSTVQPTKKNQNDISQTDISTLLGAIERLIDAKINQVNPKRNQPSVEFNSMPKHIPLPPMREMVLKNNDPSTSPAPKVFTNTQPHIQPNPISNQGSSVKINAFGLPEKKETIKPPALPPHVAAALPPNVGALPPPVFSTYPPINSPSSNKHWADANNYRNFAPAATGRGQTWSNSNIRPPPYNWSPNQPQQATRNSAWRNTPPQPWTQSNTQQHSENNANWDLGFKRRRFEGRAFWRQNKEKPKKRPPRKAPYNVNEGSGDENGGKGGADGGVEGGGSEGSAGESDGSVND